MSLDALGAIGDVGVLGAINEFLMPTLGVLIDVGILR